MTDNVNVHARIDSTGKTKLLENYEGEFGHVIYEDDEKAKAERARMKASNETVDAILREKGLL